MNRKDDASIRYFKKRLKYTDLSNTWPNILQREYVYSPDGEYAVHLQKAVAGKGSSMPVTKVQPRPTAIEVELALRQGCRGESEVRDVWQRRLQQLYRAKHKRISIEEWLALLDNDHWLERFIARHVLVHRGGEVVKPLSQLARESSGEQKDTAIWLLQSISTDTHARLGAVQDRLLCPECLVRCAELWIDLPWQRDITYYGCRSCSQSRRFIDYSHHAVAVLDNTWLGHLRQQKSALRVNWFSQQIPFDFDRVEIIRATDEEIERFAVRMGNDTDSVRKPRYGQMKCTVKCELSKNSLRVLDRIFGQVEQVGA